MLLINHHLELGKNTGNGLMMTVMAKISHARGHVVGDMDIVVAWENDIQNA